MKKTIEIPEGYEARIESNKIILEPKESEDEKMIRIIEDAICTNEAQELVKVKYGLELTNLADWLEKQGVQNLANSAKTCKIEQKHTPKHRVGDTIYYNSFGELKSMIVANVVTDSTDNPMYEDKEGNAVFEKAIIEQNPVNIDYISGIRKELLDIENNAENINGLTESQWVAIRAAHRLLGEYIVKEQKPAWSEEDREMRMKVLKYLSTRCNVFEYEEVEKWFDIIKERYTWKPSEEQIIAIRLARSFVADDFSDNPTLSEILIELENQLKKLKG